MVSLTWRRVDPSHFLYDHPSCCLLLFSSILALLDYVSRTHAIEICPSSVVRVAIISEPIEQIPFKFQL